VPAVRDQRAEQLLGSVAGEDALAMFRELGFVCVPGEEYGYLLYPHRPVVAYDARTGEVLNEYCVRFEDHGDEAGPRLPDADDVLAKWMSLRADEHALIGTANMDRPGRQMDPGQLRKDLRTYELWKTRHEA
jgi:hypothetical protein